RFNSQRVLHDYARLFYGPAARQGKAIAADGHRIAHELADWKARVRARWPGVQMRSVDQGPGVIGFNEPGRVEVDVALNGLRPEGVRVECVLHRKLCSELTVPVQGYADNRRPQNGLTYIGDETAAIWPFEPQTNVDAGADVC